jgi:hypothetical protein
MQRAGFQLSTRFTTEASAGKQAGVLRSVDGSVEVVESKQHVVQYAQHTRDGAFAETPGVAHWTVLWTAPSEGGASVGFHVAANATNDDDSEFGDFIYTRDAVSQPTGS